MTPGDLIIAYGRRYLPKGPVKVVTSYKFLLSLMPKKSKWLLIWPKNIKYGNIGRYEIGFDTMPSEEAVAEVLQGSDDAKILQGDKGIRKIIKVIFVNVPGASH